MLICFVFAAVCVSDDSSAEATETTYVSDGVTYTLNDSKVSITAYDDTTKNVLIKGKVTINSTEYSVESVPGAIFQNKSLEKLEIESGVTTISNEAFKDCISLKSISIPQTVTSIGDYAFSGCVQLNSVTIATSDDDANGFRTLGKYAFQGCKELKSIPAHKSLKPGEGCYSDSGLESLTFYFESSPYLNAKGVTLNYFIPTKLCSGCEALSEINLIYLSEKNSYNIWPNAFDGCKALTEFKFPTADQAEKLIVQKCAFMNSGLKNVEISNLTKLSDGVFQNCTSLETVKITSFNNAVFSLGYQTKTDNAGSFQGCTALYKLELPDITTFSLKTIEGCKNLKSIKINNGTSIYLTPEVNQNEIYLEEIDLGSYAQTARKDYMSGNIQNLFTIPTLKRFVQTNENGVLYVKDGAVYVNDNVDGEIWCYLVACSPEITSLTIDPTTTIISKYAFTHCKDLKFVSFPDSITKYEYVSGTDGIKFVSYTGSEIDSADLDNFKGVTYSLKDGVDGLAMCPVLTFMADGKVVEKVAYLWDGSAEYPDVPEKTGYIGVWENIGTPVRDIEVNAVYWDTSILLKDGDKVYKTYTNLSVGQIVTLSALDTENFIGWSINGLIVGAQYIVNINDVDSNGTIIMTAVFAKEDNDSWNLIVKGNGTDGKVFWTSSNAIGTYGMITALLGEFEDWGYEVSKNGVVGAISDSCLMVSSTDGEDVTVTVSFVDVGKSSDYSVSIAEIVSGGKSGFRATVTAEDDGYIDTDGTLAISYVYKTWNEADKVWVYTTSGSTAGVSDYCISISDKSIKTDVLAGDFTLETEGAILVYGYAKYSYKDTSATSEITVTVSSPVIVSFVSTIQSVIAKS